ESDQVILLYYGSAGGLDPIREKFANQLAVILVGGIRPERLSDHAKPPLVATSNHGRHLAQVFITQGSGIRSQGSVTVTLLAIEPTIKPSAEMEKVLSKYTGPTENRLSR